METGFRFPEKTRNGKRTGLMDLRLIQGWAEIAAFHLDRVMGLNMKPPMVGRMFDNHFWYSHDSSVRSLRYRNAPTFEYPMALISWLENVHAAPPDWQTIGKVLVRPDRKAKKELTTVLRSTSDTIIFDFLIDGETTKIWGYWTHFGPRPRQTERAELEGVE